MLREYFNEAKTVFKQVLREYNQNHESLPDQVQARLLCARARREYEDLLGKFGVIRFNPGAYQEPDKILHIPLSRYPTPITFMLLHYQLEIPVGLQSTMKKSTFNYIKIMEKLMMQE